MRRAPLPRVIALGCVALLLGGLCGPSTWSGGARGEATAERPGDLLGHLGLIEPQAGEADGEADGGAPEGPSGGALAPSMPAGPRAAVIAGASPARCAPPVRRRGARYLIGAAPRAPPA